MHTKREIVCTGLPEAMLIKSTALTMTRMALSGTALPGIRPVQVLSNLSLRTDRLNRASPIILNQAKSSDGWPAHKLKLASTSCTGQHRNLKMGKSGPRGALAMAARSSSQDAKRLAKKKKMEAVQSDDDEEDNQEEEDEASPSNSEVEKTARQYQKTADLRRQLQEEEKTQWQLESQIAKLKRKNRKSNVAFPQLHNSQFNEEEEEEETVHTPKTQIKCRKLSMLDDCEEDPKVILCCEERSGVY